MKSVHDCDENMTLRYIMQKQFKRRAQSVTSSARPINIMNIYGPRRWHHRLCSLATMASRFLDHVCKLSTLNVSFSMLIKRWVLILLSKLSNDYAVLG